MQKSLTTAAALLAILGSTTLQAATIDPAAFETILTEGKRTSTVDQPGSENVTGHAALAGNGDIALIDIGALDIGTDALLVGRVAGTGRTDAYIANNITGKVTVSLLNYSETANFDPGMESGPFGAIFDLLVDNLIVQSLSFFGNPPSTFAAVFNTQELDDQSIMLRITSGIGVSDYDVSFANPAPVAARLEAPSAVPLPAAGFLLMGGLAGIAALRRRRLTA